MVYKILVVIWFFSVITEARATNKYLIALVLGQMSADKSTEKD